LARRDVQDNPADAAARNHRAAIVTAAAGLKNIINVGYFAWGFCRKRKPGTTESNNYRKKRAETA
jgi:hypothetical protein